MLTIRPGQALNLLKNIALEQVRDDDPDLTIRQMAILMTIYLDPPPHTVRGLAEHLGVTKPVITRALNSMGKLELVTRRRDEKDKRNVLVQRTVAGSEYLERLGVLMAREAERVGP